MAKQKAKKLIKPVRSLAELRTLARDPAHPEYARLALVAARNLGMGTTSVETALRWLYDNAGETSEEGVVDEVNFVRDCL